MATRLYSFAWSTPGYSRGPFTVWGGPRLVLDVRRLGFRRQPELSPRLQQLQCDGRHWRAAIDIEQTARFAEKYLRLRELVASFRGVVAIGCATGRFRSVYLVERLGQELRIPIEHLGLRGEPQ